MPILSNRSSQYLVRFFADLFALELIIGITKFIESDRLFANFNFSAHIVVALLFMPIFHLSGFYTFGRYYQSRFKALIIAQAVTVGYLITNTLLLFFPKLIQLNRKSIIIAYILTLATLLITRLWSFIWKGIIREESPRKSTPTAPPDHVLVIGGAGYIGSALLGKLLAKGYRVRLLDVFLFGEEPIKEFLNHPNLEIIRGDFRQVDLVVSAVKGVDAVIHLGGIVGDPACALDEDLTIEVNLTATRTIAEIAKGFGIRRFIFVSSCSVYGASDNILNERSALNPVSLYAKSKIASELVLHEMSDTTFSPTILRFSTIFGLSGRTRFDLVVNLLTAKAVKEGQITVFGGDQWRPFLHVDDAAESVLMTLEAPLSVIANKIFNVGDNQANMTLQTAGERIKAQVPQATLLLMEADGDRRNYRVDFSKINKNLGFKVKHNLESGIQQVIDAIRSGKVLDYKDPKYSNVLFFKTSNNILPHMGKDWIKNLLKATSRTINESVLIQETTDD